MPKPPLNPAYFDAHFRSTRAAADLPARFGVLTACNPFGQIIGDSENADRTELLRRKLESLHVSHFPVTGGSQDGTHLEPGFGIEGLDQETLRTLGREFDQDAVFWVENGGLFLVPCRLDPPECLQAIHQRWIHEV